MSAAREVTILIAEDDPGHARLIEKSLARAGLNNNIELFANGQEILDFLFGRAARKRDPERASFLLLLDIHMPRVDGVEVLRQIKGESRLREIPVIMLTTTDDPREVERCHAMGCSSYIVKPVDYGKFAAAVRSFGLAISLVEILDDAGPKRDRR